jgi:hypothetical protein
VYRPATGLEEAAPELATTEGNIVDRLVAFMGANPGMQEKEAHARAKEQLGKGSFSRREWREARRLVSTAVKLGRGHKPRAKPLLKYAGKYAANTPGNTPK